MTDARSRDYVQVSTRVREKMAKDFRKLAQENRRSFARELEIAMERHLKENGKR